MSRRILAALSVCWLLLNVLPVRADDALYESLRKSPHMTPEQCEDNPPEWLMEKVQRSGIAIDCETCRDCFYAVYAGQLRPLVDKKYPAARPLREPLTQAVTELDQFLATVTDGNWFGHETERIPGRVEWLLVRIGRGRLHRLRAGKGYTHDDITRLALTFARANTDGEKAEVERRIERVLLPALRASLDQLARVERQVDPETALGLREVFMRRLGEFL
jgi:hypothetical protein